MSNPIRTTQAVLRDLPSGLSPDQIGPVCRTVYSLYWAQTQQVVDVLWHAAPHELFLDPHTKRQDGMHARMLQMWPDWAQVTLADAFPESYPTNGASEAIVHLIARQASIGGTLHVFDGEYEGYKAIAEAFNLNVQVHKRDLSIATEAFGDNDVFWISNPSSIHGDYWDELDTFLARMDEHNPDVEIYLDVTYQGCVSRLRPQDFSVHPNVRAVVFSLSKPFGVYYHRIGGVYARSPIDSLYGNRWFKNLFSIKLGEALMSAYAVDELPKLYAGLQAEMVAQLIERGELPPNAEPCNIILLARASGAVDQRFEEFYRGEGFHRFCLTPSLSAVARGE